MKEIRLAVAERIAEALDGDGEFSLPFILGGLSFFDGAGRGDLCSTISFKLAKPLSCSPLQVAERIRERLDSDLFEAVEAVAPGYLNFFIRDRILLAQLERFSWKLERLPSFWELDLGSESLDNPLFALLHARAQIESVLRLAEEAGLAALINPAHRLCAEERGLLLALLRCSQDPVCVGELLEAYQEFHRECRIIHCGAEIAGIRLALLASTGNVLSEVISRLGAGLPTGV